MNDALSEKWRDLRGLEVVSIALQSVTLPQEDADMIKNLQRQAVYRNAGMAGATLVEAQAEAMKGAANNENGGIMGFAGFNMANQAGNSVLGAVTGMEGQKGEAPAGAKFCPNCGAPVAGTNFCANCGTKLN